MNRIKQYYNQAKGYYFSLKGVIYVNKYYPPRIGLKLLLIWIISIRFNPLKANNLFTERKNAFILKWIEQEYEHLIPTQLSNSKETIIDSSEKNIFICWWQGLDKMPPIVKLCIDSIKKNADGNRVILLDKNNIQNYLDISPVLLEKAEKGDLWIAHLCDYIRLRLLYEYGGAWLDSTVFLTAPFQLQSPSASFASIRIHPLSGTTISNYQWTTFCMAACKHSSVIKVFLDVFECNFKKERYHFVDYLFIDFVMYRLYQKCNQFKQIIDQTPFSNEQLYKLEAQFKQPAPMLNIQELSGTTIFKLNWRIDVTKPWEKSVFEKIKILYD